MVLLTQKDDPCRGHDNLTAFGGMEPQRTCLASCVVASTYIGRSACTSVGRSTYKPYHLSYWFPRTHHVPVESLPTPTFGPSFTYAMPPTPAPNESRSMSSVLPPRPARPLQRKAHAPPVMSRLHHFGCLGTPVLHLRAICTVPRLPHGPQVNVSVPSSSPVPVPAP